ncbi:lytic transglycosylase domain-containing protein [Phreatobacter sp.]|uniref:lytic transglycosylase domain-containing protein n=1 Tax=Phreatobacter sp. TaxID=1966341 RepID=UPI003F6F54C1
MSIMIPSHAIPVHRTPAGLIPALPRLWLLAGVAAAALVASGCAMSQDVEPELPVQMASRDAAAPDTTGSIPPASRSWSPSSAAVSDADVAALGRILAAARGNRIDQATAGLAEVRDPVAKVLGEWAILMANDGVSFERAAAFLRQHPAFPASRRIRLRAEGMLLENNVAGSQVRQFFARSQPQSAKGSIALALALKEAGDGQRSARMAREIWREQDLSADNERRLLAGFGSVITRADHKARMDRMLHDNQEATALRAAQRLGGGQVALARAVLAVGARRPNGPGLLAAVPSSLHRDPAYLLARAQVLRRGDKPKEAAAILMAAPRDPALLGKPEEWWTERRIVARQLLEAGDTRAAYQLVATHPVRSGTARIDAEFHAGWLALRRLNDPALALRHFQAVRQASSTPMSQSRALYWIGRAQEAAGQQGAARQAFEAAARHSSHYYGQLARARLGMQDQPVRRPQASAAAASPAVRVLDILYRLNEPVLARTVLADLGLRATDHGLLQAAGERAVRAGDARGATVLGRLANNRGLPFDLHAFPTIGIPAYRHVGPEVDRAVVFAIARQESTFDPRAVSHAGARGLLQLMPGTARATARTYGLSYDQGRLTSDPAYNAQLGAAHLGELVAEFNGSYVLTFVAYNAGRARAREWIQRFGDPRDPSVDPVDWVEMIPFSETRNYVQRVMENVQVYRARLGGGSALRIEADLRRGRVN